MTAGGSPDRQAASQPKHDKQHQPGQNLTQEDVLHLALETTPQADDQSPQYGSDCQGRFHGAKDGAAWLPVRARMKGASMG